MGTERLRLVDREQGREHVAPSPGSDGARESHPILRLQAGAGNAAVASLLAAPGAAVQRYDESDEDEYDEYEDEYEGSHAYAYAEVEETDESESGDGGESDESYNPEPAYAEDGGNEEPDSGPGDAEAIAGAEERIEAALDPDSVVAALASVASPEEPGDYEVPEGDTAQALHVQRDDVRGETRTRPGTKGDVVRAALPYVRPALEWIKSDALASWRSLSLGQKAVTTFFVVPFGVGGLSQPGARIALGDLLSGSDVSLGVVPNLRLVPEIRNGNLTSVTVTYDAMPLFRSLGINF